MKETTDLEFVVMAYAVSDLVAETVPIAVVLELGVSDQTRLELHANNQIPKDFFSTNFSAHKEIEDFCHDVCACPAGDQSERLFRHLGDLGIGPIRAVGRSAGKLLAAELNQQIKKTCADLWTDVVWPDSFTLRSRVSSL